jgi:hypothetical protein
MVKIRLAILYILTSLDQSLLRFLQVLLELGFLSLKVLYLLAVLCAHRHANA